MSRRIFTFCVCPWGQALDIWISEREYGMGSDVDSRILGDTNFLEEVLGQEQEGLGRSVTMEEIVPIFANSFR